MPSFTLSNVQPLDALPTVITSDIALSINEVMPPGVKLSVLADGPAWLMVEAERSGGLVRCLGYGLGSLAERAGPLAVRYRRHCIRSAAQTALDLARAAATDSASSWPDATEGDLVSQVRIDGAGLHMALVRSGATVVPCRLVVLPDGWH